MNVLSSGRVAGLVMPVLFAVATIFCVVRVGQTSTHEYFFQQPSIEWNRAYPGQSSTAQLTWRAADLEARWKVRYRMPDSKEWKSVLAHVTGRENSDLLTKHLVYRAVLTGVPPGQPVDVTIYRDHLMVYSARLN